MSDLERRETDNYAQARIRYRQFSACAAAMNWAGFMYGYQVEAYYQTEKYKENRTILEQAKIKKLYWNQF